MERPVEWSSGDADSLTGKQEKERETESGEERPIEQGNRNSYSVNGEQRREKRERVKEKERKKRDDTGVEALKGAQGLKIYSTEQRRMMLIS